MKGLLGALAAVALIAVMLTPLSAARPATDIPTTVPVFVDVHTFPKYPLGAIWATGLGGDVITVYASIENADYVDLRTGFCNHLVCSMDDAWASMTNIGGNLWSFQLPGDDINGWSVYEASHLSSSHIYFQIYAEDTTAFPDYHFKNYPDYDNDGVFDTEDKAFIYPAWPPTQINGTASLNKTTVYPGEKVTVSGGAKYWNSTSLPKDLDPSMSTLITCEGCAANVTVGGGSNETICAPDGSYSMQITAPMLPGTYPVSLTVKNSTPNRDVPTAFAPLSLQVVPLPQISEVNLTLSANSTYPSEPLWANGSARYDTGNPAALCDLNLSLSDGRYWMSKTLADGTYSIPFNAPWPAGGYTVTATVSNTSYGTSKQNQSALTVRTPVVSLTINPSQTTMLPDTPLWVNGTATYDTGKPVAGAIVNATIPGTALEWRGAADANGNYAASLTGPSAPGSFSLNVTAFGAAYGVYGYGATPIMVTPTPIPDLVVYPQGISFNATDGLFWEGRTVRVSAVVWNLGTLGAQDVLVNFTDEGNGTLLGSAVVNVSAGQNATASINWTALPGNRTVNVTVDPANAIAESMEGNNNASKGVSIERVVADLAVYPSGISLSVQGGLFLSGRNVTISAAVHNLGNLNVSGVPVEFAAPGLLLGSVNVTVPAGGNATAQITWAAVAGNYTITVSADPANAIEEPDEANNNASAALFVDEVRDLVITDSDVTFTAQGGAFLNGRIVTVTALAKNVGSADSPPVTVLFALDNAALSWLNVSIPAHGTALAQATWAGAPGNHTFTVTIDPENAYSELNESNNIASKGLFIDVIRDLAVSAGDVMVVSGDGRLAAGRTVTAYALVKNLGSVDFEGVSVLFMVDGVIIGGATVSVRSGEAAFVKATWTAAQGNHTLGFSVDPDDTIEEANEGNNLAEKTLQFDAASTGAANSLPPEDGFAKAALVGIIALVTLISILLALASAKR